MAGKPGQLGSQRDQLAAYRRIGIESGFAQSGSSLPRMIPPDEAAGDAIQLHSIQAQRLANIAEGAARAVTDHGGGQCGAMAAVFPVNVLDHFFTALMFEIDI